MEKPRADRGRERDTPSDCAGRFDRGEALGRGSGSTVYRAVDREIGREVALKVFEDRTGDALFRLKREFRRLRGVTHPSLVQLYDLVVEPGGACFSMELLDGATEVIRYVRGELDGAQRLDAGAAERLEKAFAQVLTGLSALHAAGLLHRDLKPSNVLVLPCGRAVLLDFGMASSSDHLSTAESREFAGTPAYAAPELFEGASASTASDAYAAGALLYEAITGRPPKLFGRSAGSSFVEELREACRAISVPDIAELTAGLLEKDPRARWTIADAQAVLRVRATEDAAPPQGGGRGFVGRVSELRWLHARLAEARAGASVVGVVRGASGIGKSELVRRFLETADDAVALSGSCRPRESVPYNALDGPIDELSARLLERPRTLEIDGESVDALLRLFAVLERVPSLAAARTSLTIRSPRETTRAGLAALADLLRVIAAETPVVVWVDDAQWADEDSALAISELVAAAIPRLLVLLSYRPVDGASSLVTAIAGSPGARALELGPLSREECHELAASILASGSDARVVDAVVSHSDGSPYVLGELSRQASAGISNITQADIARRTLERFDAFAPGARAIARVVALAGSAVRVGELLAFDRTTTETLLYRMQEARLLRPGPVRSAGLEIYHDRIRDALLDDVTPEARREIHRRVVEALLGRAELDAGALAEHSLGAGDPSEAARYYVLAAEESERSLAFGRAAEMYRMALALRGRGEADWELSACRGRAIAFAGDAVRGGRMIEDAAAAAERYDAPRVASLRLRADAARELLCGGDVDGGLAALRRMVRAAGFVYPSTPRRAVAMLLMLRARLALRGFEFRETAEAALERGTLERIDACWTGIIGLNSFDAIRSGVFQAQHTFLALSAGEPKRIARALILEAAYRAVEGGERGRARAWRLLDRVNELAARLDDPRTTAFSHLCSAVVHYFSGEWSMAVEHASQGERMFERMHGAAWERIMCRMYLLWALAWSGDARALRGEQTTALAVARTSDDWLAGVVAASGHANLAWLLSDEPALARKYACDAIGRFPEIGFQSPHYADVLAQTRIDLYEGAPWEAWSRMERSWKGLSHSKLLRIQLFRCELRHLRACAAIAAARSGERAPSRAHEWTDAKLLRLAAAEARRLRREDLPIAGGLAGTIEAALAPTSEEALAKLESAAAVFGASHATLHAAAAEAAARDAGSRAITGLSSAGAAPSERVARIVVPPLG